MSSSSSSLSAFDYVTSSALSLTAAGNTGISPFLSLLLLGAIEKANPDLLKMDGWIETLLSNWATISVLSILTVLEIVGKCVPVVDEIIDSAELFVAPILSVFSSFGTLGLLDPTASSAASESTADGANTEEADGTERDLRNLGAVSDAALTGLKAVLVIVGVGLALAIHLLKMLIRLVGLACCAGCCQPCITVFETTAVVVGILVAVFVRQIAIATCILLFVGAGYLVKRKWCDKKHADDGDEDDGGAAAPSSPTAAEPAVAAAAAADDDEEKVSAAAEKISAAQQVPPPSASAPADAVAAPPPPPPPPPPTNPDYDGGEPHSEIAAEGSSVEVELGGGKAVVAVQAQAAAGGSNAAAMTTTQNCADDDNSD